MGGAVGVGDYGSVGVDKRLPNFLRDKVASFEWQERPVAEGMLYPALTNHLFEVLHRVHF
ncbi:MAG: hypothetical protein SWK90_20370 [Chloroflexota bacterium]|nr:hypothetical protein [Chloroflexota bacterium]